MDKRGSRGSRGLSCFGEVRPQLSPLLRGARSGLDEDRNVLYDISYVVSRRNIVGWRIYQGLAQAPAVEEVT